MVKFSVGAVPGEIPALLSFPQGCPDGGVSLTLGRKGAGRKRKQEVAGEAVDVPGLTYLATDFGSQSIKKDACKYAVAVYDKAKDELTLLPTDHAYLMRPSGSWNVGNLGETGSSLANYERSKSLTTVFGTVKKQRAVKANAAKIVHSDNVQGVDAVQSAMQTDITEGLGEADEAIFTLDGATQSMDEHRKAMLPAFDQDATSAKKIYDVVDIVPKNVQAALEKSQEGIEKDWFKSEEAGGAGDTHRQWTEYLGDACGSELLRCIHADAADAVSAACGDARERVKKEASAKKLRARLLFMHGLITVYRSVAGARDMRADKDPIVEQLGALPGLAHAHIFRKFTQERRRAKKKDTEDVDGPAVVQMGQVECSQLQVDRLLLHIVVLALTQNKFSIELECLAKDLGLSVKRLSLLAREVGCKLTKANLASTDTQKQRSVTVAQLNAPLTFPKRSQGPRK
jgi:hypothetical protein